MRVKLRERRFKSAEAISTGLWEAVEHEGVSQELLPAPRFVNAERVRKLAQAGVEVVFEERCKCGNWPGTDSDKCKPCCPGNKCTYGCETCFCGCHEA